MEFSDQYVLAGSDCLLSEHRSRGIPETIHGWMRSTIYVSCSSEQTRAEAEYYVVESTETQIPIHNP